MRGGRPARPPALVSGQAVLPVSAQLFSARLGGLSKFYVKTNQPRTQMEANLALAPAVSGFG